MFSILPFMTNYFELFGLKESFLPDAVAVKKKFYELSRQFHPDRFVSGGTEAMEEAERMTAHINLAYQTLKDKDATMAYMLKLKGVLEDEEKYRLSPAFLMEMMELNEVVSEAETAIDSQQKQQAIAEFEQQLKSLEEQLPTLLQAYENAHLPHEQLLALKEYFYRKKYLLRIQERIAKFALP
jgi:molecular chaperone HscB